MKSLGDPDNALLKAIPDTVDYATSIADRRSETSDARARSRDLARKLQSLVGGR